MKYTGTAEDGFAKYGLDLSVSTGSTAPVTTPETKPETPTKPSVPSTPAKPSQPAKPAPAPETSSKMYVIKKGDTLYRIGIKFGVDWKTIAHLNGITNVYRLQIGQKIMIP
jgi:2',3'-cyclic-nucleotide 2'-phosphodiesterase/3'-nucleotidase